LLIDDNQSFLAALREYVEQVGELTVVGTATSCPEALQLLEQITPDLITVDISMPGMNGLELTARVRQQWPELRVIVLTLLDSALHREAALAAGAHAFVGKAAMQHELIPAIRNVTISDN